MTKEELLKRTKNIGIRVIAMASHFPASPEAKIIRNQIVRSSTSVGANYRSACRSKSTRDFINKLKIAEEETDETLYWIEVVELTGILRAEKVSLLKKELNELLAIFVASMKTARLNDKKRTL